MVCKSVVSFLRFTVLWRIALDAILGHFSRRFRNLLGFTYKWKHSMLRMSATQVEDCNGLPKLLAR